MHRPNWFKDGRVLVSSAPTCGINKDGLDQFVVDVATGTRGDRLDDQLSIDVRAVLDGKTTSTARFVRSEEIARDWRVVPNYFDQRHERQFAAFVKRELEGWETASLGELIDDGCILRRDGHGSPSLDQRVGSVPYIKVSDLRAGFVNINPTNLIPVPLAKSMWRGDSSGLQAWDLLCPERASKNIGDFCVLMPGQEQIIVTREVIILRVLERANFDPFFLMWALTLKVVRQQWNRIIFMQTNREDAGHRYREIRIPIPPSTEIAADISTPFRTYYQSLAEHRTQLAQYLAEDGRHHYFVNPD
ncbi:MAG: hypothetical protein JJE52_09235 [Acidimicrobiia bacterium]|nr:hypothetical protein [Acidimicrobiia bacterium]